LARQAAPPSATFASGVCGKTGVSNDDRRKIAGHVTGDQAEAFRRTMKTKANYQAKNEPCT